MKASDQSDELVAYVETIISLFLPYPHAKGEFKVLDLSVLLLKVLLCHPKALEEDEARELRLTHHPLEASLEELQHRLIDPKL